MAVKAADNRWSRVKYNQTKWGASAARDALAWGIAVDWDGDGVCEANEARYMTDIHGFTGRRSILEAVGSGFEPLQSGRYVITLANPDGRFDPWNTSSPLYPNVTYGKDVRITTRDLSGSADPYPVFVGIISDIIPSRDLLNDPRAEIIVEGLWVYLRNNKARVAIQEGISADAAMALLLDSINWPTRWGRNLDASSDTLGYYWSLADETAGKGLQDLANSGAGQFFIAADGKASFRVRTNVPAATLSLTEDLLHRDIQPSQPWVNLRNLVKLTVNPRKEAVSGVIWQLLGSAPAINAGETLRFFARYTYDGKATPAKAIITPVASTDYETNDSASGAGTDRTATATMTVTDFGDTAMVEITNGHSGSVYLVTCQIRGTAIYVPDKLDVTYPDDMTTVEDPRELVQDLPWQQDVNVAKDMVQVLGSFFGDTFPTVEVKLSGRPAQQFLFDLMDTATVAFPTIGLTGQSLRVAGIGIDSQNSPQDIVTTLFLEAYPTAGVAAVWDTDVWDTGVFGW